MIIKKYTHKGKGYFKGFEHIFEYFDDNRKVDINTTGDIICRIKKRLDFYSNSTNENIKKYLFYWNNWLRIIVPDGINPHIDKGQYFVNKNYQLLEDNNLLTHNKALFLLLGLNAFEIGKRIKNFPELNCEQEPFHFPELELWRTEQNQALLTSSFFEADGKITSEKLKLLAKKNNFFTKSDERLKNRNINKDTAEKLHKLLKEDGFIDGEFNEIWQWKTYRNQLAYLARCLEIKKILPPKCHKELSNYIKDPSTAEKQLRSVEDPKDQKHIEAIDNVIKQLTQ